MNAAHTTDLASLTARIKAAHAARMARLAPAGTMPKVGDTVVEGNFYRKATVVDVGISNRHAHHRHLPAHRQHLLPRQ